jgi:Lon protease-like protein
MNLHTVGEERFRILSVRAETSPYLVGEVEYFPLVNPEPEAFNRSVDDFRRIVNRYLQLMEQTGKLQTKLDKPPEDRILFIYAASSLLQIPTEARQELLSTEDGLSLVDQLRSIYLREMAILRSILTYSSRREGKTFSNN